LSAVREVRDPAVLTGVPDAFLGVDVVVAEVLRLIEADRVEDVELDLRSPERGVGDPGRGEERLGLLRDVARVARVRPPRERVDDVAYEVQRLDAQDRIDERTVRVRQKEHVALVNVLEAADRRAVEADAVDEEALAELLDRDREVLPRPGQIDEAKVDDLRLGLFRELQDVLGRRLRASGCRGGGPLGAFHGQGHV